MDDLFAKLVRGEMSLKTYENGGKAVDYEVGARVKCVASHDENTRIINKLGTIIHMRSTRLNITIEFDENVGGHSDHGGKNGHVWNIPKHKLVLI